MSPEECEAQRQRVIRFWNHWCPILGMEEWSITSNFYDGEFIMQDGNASGRAVASTYVRWEYRHANIAWNLEAVAQEDDDQLEQHVIHEAMHILLNEMREEDLKHEERVAQTLAFAFMRTKGGSEE